MKQARYPGQGVILATVSAVAAVSSLMVINLFQTLSFVFIPFSRKLFRKSNTFLAGLWWKTAFLWGQIFFRSKTAVIGDAISEKENAIVFGNHQQMPDVFNIWNVAIRAKMLDHCKWFAKASLKWVPGIGCGLWCIDGIFLDRDWEADKARVLGYMSKFKREQIPMWLVFFPEGTRLTPKKLSASQKFAESRGLPKLTRVLTPRTKGFVTSVEGLRDHCTAIYIVTTYYHSGVSNLWHWMRGLGGDTTVHYKRFPMSEVPKSEKALAGWLMVRFQEMDALLASLAAKDDR